MLHLAAYIMMPWSGLAAPAAAPTPGSTSSASTHVALNSTSLGPGVSISPDRAGNQDLINALLQAPTAADRLNLLPDPSDHLYDFNNPPLSSAITTGNGGHTVKADRKDFPALIGTGVSMTVGFIGPCGFNTPHTHPRSAEINIVVEGSLGTEYILENGAPYIRNRLDKYMMTVFPQGAIHTEWNPECNDAVFVAGFASEDPGVQQSAQRLFDLDDDVLEAVFANDFTFDGRDIDQFRSLIPANVANGVESCLAKCGISKR
ncbi:hypothetical protein PV08_07281 [Exophiala spinifera]|uniref:Cupin type-1 domain-containing protein n=1 Tax=Exophiala spinifera TaxID=91928 RepID=A0A0D1ZNY8_9EURO|nr:uncharacterized protein PV08_07281 [Exophiala spinifera]KIW14497.1 hypothetical protein PV08_07281 [Exophiala spinifera]